MKSLEREALAAAWDKATAALENDAMRPIRYAKCFRYLVSALDRDARTLEAGCGEGSGLLFFRTIGFKRVTGIDVSFERLMRAKRKTDRDTELLLISPNHGLPFKDECFDAVISAAVIEHTVDARFFVQEIARVTRSGGCVIISSDCYSWRILQMLGIYRSIQPIDRALFPTTLFRYFADSGLRLIHCEGFPDPLQEFRFLRLFVGHFIALAKGMVRKVVPESMRGLMRRYEASPAQSILSVEDLLQGFETFKPDSWKPRHWVLSFPKLVFSDENVFFLVKN